MPLDLIHPSDIEQWREYTIEYYQHNSEFKYTYMKTHFWKLEHLSCVLVCRNRQLFNDNSKIMEALWATIEKERVGGYEHRAPNRKQKRENIVDLTTKSSGGCLLQFNKETGKITVVKKEIETETNNSIVQIPDLSDIDINFDNFTNNT
jgi:hypothetical protein